MIDVEMHEDATGDAVVDALTTGLQRAFGSEVGLADVEVEAVVNLVDGAIARRISAGMRLAA